MDGRPMELERGEKETAGKGVADIGKSPSPCQAPHPHHPCPLSWSGVRGAENSATPASICHGGRLRDGLHLCSSVVHIPHLIVLRNKLDGRPPLPRSASPVVRGYLHGE